MDLRQRLEIVAVKAANESFPGAGVSLGQTRIRQLLGFIPVAYVGSAPPSELLGMVRTARHIYKRSSDVLHGRSSMVNLSTILVAEWSEFVEELERLVGVRDCPEGMSDGLT